MSTQRTVLLATTAFAPIAWRQAAQASENAEQHNRRRYPDLMRRIDALTERPTHVPG